MTLLHTPPEVSGQEDPTAAVHAAAARARVAARALRSATRTTKDAALRAMADGLVAATPAVLAANADDVALAQAAGTSPALVDRLTLTAQRLAGIAQALRDVADLPDPVGEVVRGSRLPNGLQLTQVRVPLGVIGVVYEARPNVTVDAAGLALKSGNAVLLRGSSSGRRSNRALVDAMREALLGVGLPADAVQAVPGDTHASVQALITARGLVDLVVPRGGADLIQAVVTGATVPVIETGVGNCHVYVDEAADVDMAVAILLNSKAQRVSVCNAAETLLVHAGIAEAFLPVALAALAQEEVTVHGDAAVVAAAAGTGAGVVPVTEADWLTEYYSLDIAAGVVASLDDALAHIARYGSGHTEAIVTGSTRAAAAFVAGVDAAAVMVNASTRFTDGGEFGFGAEIGISTQKLHARGPMGLTEMTTTTYVVVGDGHVRP